MTKKKIPYIMSDQVKALLKNFWQCTQYRTYSTTCLLGWVNCLWQYPAICADSISQQAVCLVVFHSCAVVLKVQE